LDPPSARGVARGHRVVPVQNELVPTDRLDEQRPAPTDEVKRLGDHPGVILLTTLGFAVAFTIHTLD
jgi:hypothetical protein